MKERIRIGLRIKLPFGLFPGCATAVIYGDFAKARQKVQDLKDALYAFGNDKATEFADKLFCEKG